MIDLGVLVTEGRWLRLRDGSPPGWWQEAYEQEARVGVRRLLVCTSGVEPGGESAAMLVAGRDRPEVGRSGPLPALWLNDLAAPTQAEARLLRSLNGQPQVVVFNETNRFRKKMLHAMLSSSAALRPYLPPVAETQDEPGLYLLAPSRGPARRALWLSALELGLVRHYWPATGVRGEQKGSLRELVPFLSPEGLLLRLPAWPEGPVEWRFYLHMTEPGNWKVGAEVAKHDALREAGRRERCWPLAEAAERLFDRTGRRLAAEMRTAALSVARTLSLYQPGLVHCAVDFWIVRPEQIFLADVAGRYRTDWLARSGQQEALARIHEFPLRFAAMLAHTGVEKLHVDYGRARATGGTGAPAPRDDLESRPGPAAVRRRKRPGDCDDPCPERQRDDC